MDQEFGGARPQTHIRTDHRKPARYLVLIDSGGTTIARLFLETRERVADFDPGTEETALMTRGLSPQAGAEGAEWDKALEGHSSAERASAQVYTLDL